MMNLVTIFSAYLRLTANFIPCTKATARRFRMCNTDSVLSAVLNLMSRSAMQTNNYSTNPPQRYTMLDNLETVLDEIDNEWAHRFVEDL